MRIAAALLALPLMGCWDWNDAHTPGGGGGEALAHVGIPPIVVVASDSVTVLPIGPVGNGDHDYDWPCSAPQANLTIAGVSGGSIRIEITDAAGVLVHDNVYSGGLVGAVTGMTSPDGAPGEWSVRFTFHHVLSIGAIEINADVFDDPDKVVIGGSYAMAATYEFEAGWADGPAGVTIASSIAYGTVRIRLWDGDGTLVLDRTNFTVFIGAFTGDSNDGAAGTWRILIDINAAATAGGIVIDHP